MLSKFFNQLFEFCNTKNILSIDSILLINAKFSINLNNIMKYEFSFLIDVINYDALSEKFRSRLQIKNIGNKSKVLSGVINFDNYKLDFFNSTTFF
ncbi:hypothetical protein [Buchnera aphidicola]|uniref:hypothetical protein n=1 Tax=Buchnera aphidicola TaxID=9 RepID=UPI0005C6F1B5|nr:hypothetical protein [Buchnera aphidicola]